MSDKKAFTLIEIVVTLALVCSAIILWTYVLSVGRGQNEDLDDDQVYNNLRASLIQTLKRDVRSSLAIREINPGSWEIDTVEFDKDGLPHKKLVKYAIDAKCSKISISESGGVKTYDFAKVLNGKKLNFKIIP